MPARPINQLTLEEYQALVTGIPKYCPNAIFTVASQTFTAPQAVTFITSVLDAVSAVSTAKTAWADARLAETKIVTQDGAAVRAIQDNIALMFSNNTTTLAAFLITPKKPRQPLSVEARAAATAKARATRVARGTESKKKKAEISGNVTGVTITPVVTSGPSAPATAPAQGTTPVPTGTSASTPGVSGPALPATTQAAPPPVTPAATSGAASAPTVPATANGTHS